MKINISKNPDPVFNLQLAPVLDTVGITEFTEFLIGTFWFLFKDEIS